MSRVGAAILFSIAACSGSNDAPKAEPITPPPADAGARTAPTQPLSDPSAPGMPAAARPTPKRPGRPIEIILRSNPPGAQVAVDGTPYGVTPQVWSGETGGEHEFTFTMGGYSMARYRFIPITTGILHARLEPMLEDVDAGVAAPPEVLPPGIPMVPSANETIDAPATPLAPPPDAFVPDARAPGLGPPF